MARKPGKGITHHDLVRLRPTEYGPDQTTDLTPQGDWDIVARDFSQLARRLGA